MLNRVNLTYYLLSVLILVTTFCFHPFVFSFVIPDQWRYAGIALVSLAALIYALRSRVLIVEPYYFAWILFFASLSAVFTQYDLKFYYIYISSVLFLFSLLLLLKTNQEFRNIFEAFVLVTFALYAIYTISGFVYINFFDGELLAETPIYNMLNGSDASGGYVYDFHKFFGSFANVGLGNTNILRSVGVTWEPNSTGILFVLAIAITTNCATLHRRYKIPLNLIFGIAATVTISVTCLAILCASIFLFAYKRSKSVIFRGLIVTCFLGGLFMALPKLQSTSLNIRVEQIKFLLDYMVLNFDIVDHLFGRGFGWSNYEIQSGIDAGYLFFYSQLGLTNTIALLVLWAVTARANSISMATMFLSPLALNLQMSLIYLLFVALLLVDIKFSPESRS